MGWAAALALAAALAQPASAASSGDLTLVLPHPLRAGERASLQVTLGRLARGQEIEVTTASGRPLGVISPYGVRSDQDGGTYAVPLPDWAVVGGRISIRLTITPSGAPARPPTADEVRGVTLSLAAPRP